MSDSLYEMARRWADMANDVANELRPLTEHIPCETWILADGLADELGQFAVDLRTELMVAQPASSVNPRRAA